jgi:preprotein translocase subunit SecG
MTTVLLVVHIMVATALVAVVLWQRSEGGALGIGGGGGGFLTGRGTANLLTRTTAVLAACFFLTSILLTMISHRGPTGSAFDTPAAPAGSSTIVPTDPNQQPTTTAPAAPSDTAPRGGILDKLR